MGDQCTFDLGSSDIMSGHDDDVISPADDHDIPLLAFHRKVTGTIAVRDGIQYVLYRSSFL